MIDYDIRPEAAAELAEAASWYDRAVPGLGADLLAEFDSRLRAALQLPGAGTIVATTSAGRPVRRYRLRRFKRYAILMVELGGRPTVLAFACSSRRPDHWRDRVG